MPGTRSAAASAADAEADAAKESAKAADDSAKADADAEAAADTAAKEAEEKAKAEEERRKAVEEADAELAEGVVPAPEPMDPDELQKARQKEAEENAPLVDEASVLARTPDETTSPVRTAEGAGARLSAEGAEQAG